MKAKVLGVMKFIDSDEVDDKIICVPADDRNNGDAYNTLEDLPKQTLKQIEHHFNHYKDLKKPGSTEVKAFEGLDSAKKVIAAAIKRYQDAYPEQKVKQAVKDTVEKARKAIEEL